jgi:DNA polymerase V
MFGLADCNNFYVSCERVFNPSLCGKPVVVLSNNDGCVISRSNEAKIFGIKVGQPYFEIRHLVQTNNINILSSNFILYGDMSQRVMDTFRQFTPQTEVYSIDEAFFDFEGINDLDVKRLGRDIVERVKRNTGIPISLGISGTKTLAKVASKLCKQYPKLKGMCIMNRKEDIEKVLKNFPIEDVWGIGRRYSKRLKSADVISAADFLSLNPAWILKNMTTSGLRIWKELNGEPCIGFEESFSGKRNICTSRSFASGTVDFEEIYKSVAYFTTISAEKLRKQRCVTGQIYVFLLTNLAMQHDWKSYTSIVVPLENHTDSTLELVKYAGKGLTSIFNHGYKYKKAGVILSDISIKSETPGSLFYENDPVKQSNLMSAMDDLNKRYGKHYIKTAAEGTEGFKSNRNLLSPKYTTDWNDIIKVKV